VKHTSSTQALISLFSLLFSLLFSNLFADIAIYGDTQYNNEVHSQIVSAIVSHKPDIAFHSGDYSNYGKEQSEYDNFFAIEKPLTDICPLYPAKGNHERSRELFLANFPVLNGKTYYTVEHDSLLFIILDATMGLKPLSEQHTWLQQTLSADSLTAKIIIMHYPVFSSGYHGTDMEVSLFFPTMIKGYNVVMVSSGHDHDYERLEYDGISYFVSGGSGGRLRDERNFLDFSKTFVNAHNYLILSRDGKTLTVTAYALDGSIIESTEIRIP